MLKKIFKYNIPKNPYDQTNNDMILSSAIDKTEKHNGK
jgi:hypothetical protein